MPDFGSKGGNAQVYTLAPHSAGVLGEPSRPDVPSQGTSAKAEGYVKPISGNNDKNRAH